ncbi:hypothetical protein SETIT_8G223200v2 [Setaria italica]|uniref:Hydrophobic seed protein domain-containing protein n=1 Tax=Setaria italica TaxID=4555 RepID=A0A368SAF2_SETIT|nr:hypothetical protein SETIT_8G223200v2 [Setaria italica]
MAPKSAAALVLLAAMIAGLAPPLQAQLDARAVNSFFILVDQVLCPRDNVMKSCARQIASRGATIPTAILNPVSGEGTRCACGLGNVAAALGFDVFRRCQQFGGPFKQKASCCSA